MIRVRNTFVVEIDPAEPSIASSFRGRVEHVLSGARYDFGSSEMLLNFIARALERHADAAALKVSARCEPGAADAALEGDRTKRERTSVRRRRRT